MCLNVADMERIETKYRKTLKCMLSLPDCTNSEAVYLSIGVLPATAQRDIEILGLLGQLAMCDTESQSVRGVMENTLTFYGVNFNGWSGLARRTCIKYDLPDPLQYLQYPWRADRWKDHCKKIVYDYWEKQFLLKIKSMDSLQYVDIENISVGIPMRVWQMAGLCSEEVKMATVVNWMVLGVYFTRVFLHKMKKIKTPLCQGCNEENEDLPHFLLKCSHYDDIRESYLPKYFQLNLHISEILDNQGLILQTILDPLASRLPASIRNNWSSVTTVYRISRQFCFHMHRRREKLYSEKEKGS